MARRFVDLSVPLENGVVSDAPGYLPKIDYIDHRSSVDELRSVFPGLQPQDLPDGDAWAIERIQLITHNGTHLDAPYHFESHDPRLIWEGHKAGREIGYCHLEKLHNLEGFTVSCFPVKIRNASAGWTRAVAIIDEKDGD